MDESQKKLNTQDRELYVEVLAMRTGISSVYYASLSDEKLESEYLLQLGSDPVES